MKNEIAANFNQCRARMAHAAHSAGRDATQIVLAAVTKKQPVAAIEAALEAGQRLFAENRVQEAKLKYPALKKEHPDLRLHLIGPLQTNKIDEALQLFDVIETLDRPKLAHMLAAAMAKENLRPELYIEVNIGREPQKAGIMPEDLHGFIALCRDELKLPVTGLMCIPPANEDPEHHFRAMKDLQTRYGLKNLSMGMSGDYETAILCGATEIRVGTALFGERQ